MRYLNKRLTVRNDGFCNCKKPASERIDNVINRYVVKMQKKGWIPCDFISAGNAFAVFEAYVRLAKPRNKKEKEFAIKMANDSWGKKSESGFYTV